MEEGTDILITRTGRILDVMGEPAMALFQSFQTFQWFQPRQMRRFSYGSIGMQVSVCFA